MDATRFDNALKNELRDASALVWDAAQRGSAMYRAVREFSRYFPLFRRFGAGVMYADANAAQAVIKVSGGLWAAGNTIIVGALGATSETKVILSVAQPSTDDLSGNYVQLTLTTNLANAHGGGEFVHPAAFGISIEPSTESYLLPTDFVRPDSDSWDQAIGYKSKSSKISSFYDLVYDYSQALSGVGYGQSMNFGARRPPVFPFGFPSANEAITSWRDTQYLTWRFVVETSRPHLIILPAPVSAATLDVFYYAQHVIATVPDHEMEALLAYATHVLLKGKSVEMSRKPDWKNDVAFVKYGMSAESLATLSAQSLERWDILIRKRPALVAG